MHIKEEWHNRTTEVGMACVDAEHVVEFMWGKDTARYLMVIDDVEYDLECDGDMAEKVNGIIDFHEAFYVDK